MVTDHNVTSDIEGRKAIDSLKTLDGEINTLRLCVSKYPLTKAYHQDNDNTELLMILEQEHEQHCERLEIAMSERSALNKAINSHFGY